MRAPSSTQRQCEVERNCCWRLAGDERALTELVWLIGTVGNHHISRPAHDCLAVSSFRFSVSFDIYILSGKISGCGTVITTWHLIWGYGSEKTVSNLWVQAMAQRTSGRFDRLQWRACLTGTTDCFVYLRNTISHHFPELQEWNEWGWWLRWSTYD